MLKGALEGYFVIEIIETPRIRRTVITLLLASLLRLTRRGGRLLRTLRLAAGVATLLGRRTVVTPLLRHGC